MSVKHGVRQNFGGVRTEIIPRAPLLFELNRHSDKRRVNIHKREFTFSNQLHTPFTK